MNEQLECVIFFFVSNSRVNVPVFVNIYENNALFIADEFKDAIM